MWTGGLNSAQSLRSALASMNADRRAMPEKSGTFRAHHADKGRSISGPRAIYRFVIRFSGSGGRDSNPRQPAWEAGTLPTELPPRCFLEYTLRRMRSLPPGPFGRALTGGRQSSYTQSVHARGRSSAGRALQSHCRGRGFESPRLHPSQGSERPGAMRRVVHVSDYVSHDLFSIGSIRRLRP